MREWAEKHIRLRKQSKTVRFRCDSQPISGLFFDAYDSGLYPEMVASGPSQSSKTTTCFLIPTAYTAHELRENQVLGIPLDEMVDDKVNDLYRMFRDSPELRGLLPRAHRDGKGGTISDKQTLTNDCELKPMTRGSGDVGKAGYPARCVNVTEAADWSAQSSTSPEADPLRQLKARQMSFKRPTRRLVVEGTLTVPEELPWRLRGEDLEEGDPGGIISTQSRLLCPCPHGPHWIEPTREHLVGWRGAVSEHEAIDKAHFVCPECGKPISDDQRRRSVASVRLVHAGQVVNHHGDVVGEHPPVSTLWFHWRAYHNLLLEAADTAVEEWRASQLEEGTEERDNAERALCQFHHSEPYTSQLVQQEKLDSKKLCKKLSSWPRNVTPPDATRVVVACDIGDWAVHWLTLAARPNNSKPIVTYGKFGVKDNRDDDVNERLYHAMNEWIDQVCEPGFAIEGAGRYLPDQVWIDGNYLSDTIARVIRDRGDTMRGRYRFARGAGRSRRKAFGGGAGTAYVPKKRSRTVREVGVQWYGEINFDRRCYEHTFNADYYKLLAIAGLGKKAGTPGSIVLPHTLDAKEHLPISTHFANERLTKTWKPGKGQVEEWKRSGQQHWLDDLAMCLAALNATGFCPDDQEVEDLQQGEADVDPTEQEESPPVAAGSDGANAFDWGALQ